MIPFHTQLKQINRNKLILLEHEIMFLKTLTTYRQMIWSMDTLTISTLPNNQAPSRTAHTNYIYPSPTHPQFTSPNTHITTILSSQKLCPSNKQYRKNLTAFKTKFQFQFLYLVIKGPQGAREDFTYNIQST